MRQRAAYSQVFLKNQEYIDKVISHIDCEGKKTVEIGSGDGRLSAILAKKTKFLYCIEIDPRLALFSQAALSSLQNTKVVNSDFRDISLTSFGQGLILFSSAPYYLSSKLIEYLIDQRKALDTVYLILQKEFALKLAALPGDKAYGLIGCLIQYYAKVNCFFTIPPTAFKPRPKVSSIFLEISFKEKMPYRAKNEGRLIEVIRLSFRQRRKKINTILKKHFSEKCFDLLFESGLNPNKRPEELSIKEFCQISNYL